VLHSNDASPNFFVAMESFAARFLAANAFELIQRKKMRQWRCFAEMMQTKTSRRAICFVYRSKPAFTFR